jgi:D-amino-acid dehydrogenase
VNGRSALVIGAGVVGLCAAHALASENWTTRVVDRDPEGDKTSLGNAGGLAVTEVAPASMPGTMWRAPFWLLDPLGPLFVRPRHMPRLVPWLWRFARAGRRAEVERIAAALASLNAASIPAWRDVLAVYGLSAQIAGEGALAVYGAEKGWRRDEFERALKQRHNVEVATLSGDEAREFEPALGPLVKQADYFPQWRYVGDPAAIVRGLRQGLVNRGVPIVKADATRVARRETGGVRVEVANGQQFEADVLVVAGGAWSGALAQDLGDRVLLESERGYNATVPDPGVMLRRQIIFPEGKFVATPLSVGLRIGGAAEFGGLEAPENLARVESFTTLARRFLPGLRLEGARRWSGHRPATPDSLPVIGPSRGAPEVVYAFGHGHLGLTQAAVTARLVAAFAAGRAPPLDPTPFSIERFRGAR